MEAKKAQLMKEMSEVVFDISLDSQEGAIFGVLDEMADQYIKEQLLAYFLLLKNKYPLTQARTRFLRLIRALIESSIWLGISKYRRPRRFDNARLPSMFEMRSLLIACSLLTRIFVPRSRSLGLKESLILDASFVSRAQYRWPAA
jgi:hypothetical protein